MLRYVLILMCLTLLYRNFDSFSEKNEVLNLSAISVINKVF
jgi:hypothetical protein